LIFGDNTKSGIGDRRWIIWNLAQTGRSYFARAAFFFGAAAGFRGTIRLRVREPFA